MTVTCTYLHVVINSSQRLYKHIHTFVLEFIATSRKEIKCLAQIKVKMPKVNVTKIKSYKVDDERTKYTAHNF